MGHPLNAFAIPELLILITVVLHLVKPIWTGWNFRAARARADTHTGAPWVLTRSRPPKYQSAWAAPAGTRSSARSSGVHMLVVTLPGRAGKKEKRK
jgi:hypothetical protein